MDPFLISLIWALGLGLAGVAGKLADKGIVEPALEPVTDKLKTFVQGGYKSVEKETALVGAVRAAIADTTQDLSGFRKPERSFF